MNTVIRPSPPRPGPGLAVTLPGRLPPEVGDREMIVRLPRNCLTRPAAGEYYRIWDFLTRWVRATGYSAEMGNCTTGTPTAAAYHDWVALGSNSRDRPFSVSP